MDKTIYVRQDTIVKELFNRKKKTVFCAADIGIPAQAIQ
jgi:hypothetical protein